jgi:hypothetical protein
VKDIAEQVHVTKRGSNERRTEGETHPKLGTICQNNLRKAISKVKINKGKVTFCLADQWALLILHVTKT